MNHLKSEFRIGNGRTGRTRKAGRKGTHFLKSFWDGRLNRLKDLIAVQLLSVYTRNMATNEIQTKNTRSLAARLIFAALKVLKENGGEMRGKQVLEEVEKRVQLGDWEKQRYEKTGYIRWRSVLHFYTIDLIKAGFLVKKERDLVSDARR